MKKRRQKFINQLPKGNCFVERITFSSGAPSEDCFINYTQFIKVTKIIFSFATAAGYLMFSFFPMASTAVSQTSPFYSDSFSSLGGLSFGSGQSIKVMGSANGGMTQVDFFHPFQTKYFQMRSSSATIYYASLFYKL